MSLRALVGVKRAVHYAAKIRVKPDKSGVVTDSVKFEINPFCDIALEEALRLKEKGVVSEVVAMSVGPKKAEEQLRSAMGKGADKAIHVVTDEDLEPLNVAKLFQSVLKEDKFDLVFLGKQAIDDDSNQTGQMLAGLMNWPQATSASKVNINGVELEVTREVDDGLETIKMSTPAVITADLRLNEPRFASIRNIMMAKKKPITTKTPQDLGVDVSPHIVIKSVEEPAARQAGIIVEDVDQLYNELKSRGCL